MFRRPQFPVIVVVDDRVFRVRVPRRLGRLLQRELECALGSVRLLDSEWSWFDVLIEEEVIVRSFLDGQRPSKQALIALVNGHSNREQTEPMYAPRLQPNRTR